MNVSNLANGVSSNQWNTFIITINSSVASWSGLILGTSLTALAGFGVYRWSQANAKGNGSETEDSPSNFAKIKEKVSHAYGYVFGAFGLTAATAVLAHVSGISRAILLNPYLTIPVFLGSITSLTVTMFVPKDQVKAKHIAWAVFNTTMGITLSPLGFLNQKLVAQAAAVSLGLGGVMTLTTFLAPDKKFLKWEGPLMAALTTISLASCAALFFPGSAFAYGVDRVSLYGGLAIFTGLFMSSTQRLLQEAETQSDETFDAINSSLSIYLDGVNIFVKVLRILVESKEGKKS